MITPSSALRLPSSCCTGVVLSIEHDEVKAGHQDIVKATAQKFLVSVYVHAITSIASSVLHSLEVMLHIV